MDKERKKQLRGILFQHLDGITLCSTIAAFFNKGITEFILRNKTFSIQEILNKYECNLGYMNVTLHLLVCQGWLKKIDNHYFKSKTTLYSFIIEEQINNFISDQVTLCAIKES